MRLLTVFLCFLAVNRLFGETFISDPARTNFISIREKEAIQIKYPLNSWVLYESNTTGEVTVVRNSAFAGPAKLTIGFAVFDRISGEFNTIVLTNRGTRMVDVPEGKGLQWFPTPTGRITFIKGEAKSSINLNNLNIPPEPVIVDGPLTVEFQHPYNFNSSYFTYRIVDLQPSTTSDGSIKVPPGKAQVTLEKSDALLNWKPEITYAIDQQENSFYRLRIDK